MPEEPSSEESDIEFLARVALESKESEVHAVGFAKEIYAEMLIDSKKVNFQIYCGASINVYIVRNDHKPLESILKKPLSSAPRRLQGMMMRLQKYNIDVHYECGAKMYIADLLSRA